MRGIKVPNLALRMEVARSNRVRAAMKHTLLTHRRSVAPRKQITAFLRGKGLCGALKGTRHHGVMVVTLLV